MSLYVLDTDILSLWLHGHSRVCQNVAAHDATELYTTIVTIEEILSGWYTQVRRAKSDEQLARATPHSNRLLRLHPGFRSSLLTKQQSGDFTT